jgi:hypothetical protein
MDPAKQKPCRSLRCDPSDKVLLFFEPILTSIQVHFSDLWGKHSIIIILIFQFIFNPIKDLINNNLPELSTTPFPNPERANFPSLAE